MKIITILQNYNDGLLRFIQFNLIFPIRCFMKKIVKGTKIHMILIFLNEKHFHPIYYPKFFQVEALFNFQIQFFSALIQYKTILF